MLEETLSSEDTGMDLSLFFEHHKKEEKKTPEDYEKYNIFYFFHIFGYSPENPDYTFMLGKIKEISNKHN